MSIRNMMIGGAGASPPDAPTGVSAGSATLTTMVVSFSAPANNGGSAITGFTVTSSPAGGTATGASSPLTVTGLTNSTSYTFTVTATNAIGTSPASSPSSAVSTATPEVELYSFTSATFTANGQTGRNGPSLETAKSGLTENPNIGWKNNTSYFNMTTTGIQRWTVPLTATYRINAQGARGLNPDTGTAGRSANIVSDASLSKGEIILIAVGQQGIAAYAAPAGGATYVVRETGTVPLVIAGGGGGGGITNTSSQAGIMDALVARTGTGRGGAGNGSGVYGGSGGSTSGTSGGSGGSGNGGGGFTGNGEVITEGRQAFSFINGARGGDGPADANNDSINNSDGGFGGGGGGGNIGGGGGGFNGGNNIPYQTGPSGSYDGGYGGTSYYVEGTLVSSSVSGTGHGSVTITKL